jgi:hypothetical protein
MIIITFIVIAELIQVGSFISINSAESKMNLYESQLSKLWKGKPLEIETRLSVVVSRLLTFAVFCMRTWNGYLIYFTFIRNTIDDSNERLNFDLGKKTKSINTARKSMLKL